MRGGGGEGGGGGGKTLTPEGRMRGHALGDLNDGVRINFGFEVVVDKFMFDCFCEKSCEFAVEKTQFAVSCVWGGYNE